MKCPQCNREYERLCTHGYCSERCRDVADCEADIKALRERVGKVAEGLDAWYEQSDGSAADRLAFDGHIDTLQAIAEGR